VWWAPTPHVRASTRKGYATALNARLRPCFDDTPIGSTDRAAVKEFAGELAGRGLAPSRSIQHPGCGLDGSAPLMTRATLLDEMPGRTRCRSRATSDSDQLPLALPLLFVSYEPVTLAQLASLIATAADVEHRRLLFAEFLEEHQHESATARRELIAARPPSTGIDGWDALLAGLAEHLAEIDQVDPPDWVEDSSRFLDEPWCFFDLPFFRAEAERETPEVFRRHGVLIRAVELERV